MDKRNFEIFDNSNHNNENKGEKKPMKNSIVGLSRENDESKQLIAGISDIGKSIMELASGLQNHEDRLSTMEDTMRVNGIQEKKVTELVNYIIVSTLGGKKSNAYKNKSIRGKAYAEINKRIKDRYGVPRRAELPAKDYDSAMAFIENWTPDYELRLMIKEANDQTHLF